MDSDTLVMVGVGEGVGEVPGNGKKAIKKWAIFKKRYEGRMNSFSDMHEFKKLPFLTPFSWRMCP